MDGVANEADYDQYGNPTREDDNDDEVYVVGVKTGGSRVGGPKLCV